MAAPPSWDSATYLRVRPSYPPHLWEAVYAFAALQSRDLALDVGCGPGQVTVALASEFARVVGLDTSEDQVAEAPRLANVEYRVGRSEATGLPPTSVDLLTCGAALHWFDLESFYREARRVLKPQGALAAFSTGDLELPHHPAADAVRLRFRQQHLTPFIHPKAWRIISDGYRGCEPRQGSDFAEVQHLTLDWPRLLSVRHMVDWHRSTSICTAFCAERGAAVWEEVLAGYQGELLAACGVADPDTPLPVVTKLELILAKGPLPLEPEAGA